MEQRPNKQEIQFLSVSYNFFLDVFDEIGSDEFWRKNPYYRLSRIKDAFLTYSEVLEYEPIGWFLDALKKSRPPMEAELSKEFCLFVRNLLIHFPFFKAWDEVKFTKGLINWSKPGRTIDKFMSKYCGHAEVKYRMWNGATKTMTYVSIRFPATYEDATEVSLADFMPEKEGMAFVFSLMHRVLMSQVENITPKP
jgi:hypothetical protein